MLRFFYALLSAVLLSGCAGSSHEQPSMRLDYAEGFTVTEYKDYTKVVVLNPWEQDKVLRTYLLVPRDAELPDTLPQGSVIRTPLKSVLAYSDVHVRAVKELGHVSSVKSVCDAAFFKTPEIVDGLENATVTDCGSSMAPMAERIVSANPEAILLSPYQNAGYGALSNTGIPIVELADYMERTPLGRAEWIRFLGLLYGEKERADSIFRKVETDYLELKKMVSDGSERPSVISEALTNGVWYVPGGRSYKAEMYKDAGAAYPWADDGSAGSLALDFPQVLDRAQDADFWLLTTMGTELNREMMLELYPHNGEFMAYKTGNVYYFNSMESGVFEETPFHPERLLADYIKIFHPKLLPDYALRYYRKMGD